MPNALTVDTLQEKLSTIRTELEKAIIGQKRLLDLSLTTILSGGHLLLVGVPGLAKTKLSKDLATVLSLDTKRIQCTPDLMPSDILGSEILDETKSGSKKFTFLKGPIFSQLLLADEINRTSPRTQSALLEAMQEKQVTVAGTDYLLPTPFHVIATQNPIEQEGTYPLPEAQLDRFLMQINIEYPDQKSEKQILLETSGNESYAVQSILTQEDLISAQHLIKDLAIGDKLVDHILNLLKELRPETSHHPLVKKHVEWGPGTRAGQSFITACRAYALLNGRTTPLLDDLLAIAKPVLRHRIGLSFSARADGLTIDALIDQVSHDL